MLKIIDIVANIMSSDEIASEAMRSGLLNYSAYATVIQPKIEQITLQKVQKGTIVVALSRLAKQKRADNTPLKPAIKIENISVRSSLSLLSFDKTPDIQRRVATMHPFLLPVNDVFSMTEGNSEITIVCTEKAKDIVKQHIDTLPKFVYDDAVAVIVHFDSKYITIANFLYTLSSSLAVKRINILEIISTATEVSFIVAKNDMEEVVKALNSFS